MARDEIISAIDIGSTSIRVVCGQLKPGKDGNNIMQIIGAASAPSEGISKGSIISIEDAVSSISSALEKCERMTGAPIEHALVSINGAHVVAQESHGVVAVSKANGEVGEDDVERVISAAQSVATPPNYEILHVIPRSFSVDEQSGIKDPVGMTGIKLEADAQIILGMTSHVKNITKTVYRTGVDIDDLVVEVLAASESVLTNRQKDLGVAVVNLGGATTGLMVFEEGDVLHTKILPVGAGHITNDIAIGLRTSVDVAEQVKIDFGTALSAEVPKRDEIDLSQIDEKELVRVSRKEVAEIIEARLEEIFEMLKKELKSINRDSKLPSGIVFTGGGAKLHGLIEMAKTHFRTNASIGTPINIQTAIDKIQDPQFSTAVGLVQWGQGSTHGSNRHSLRNLSSVAGVTGKMGKWFKSLMP
ncbi:MAG: cell division protein FtsA [Candidatus Kerfeldbacteria bacterium RIFOXYA2_FULL_38_24]|uniref:Cell division protein FtsA n=1 Tax=Candidatus Kerfeldbacteria bacterium RIFOXYB2_FULL_38_14 TaxID=1798547 RepID=A0A1G2BGA6_9BACT|nr:MAG: cell division protein FtsA [Candidatus Kerfeldbacteria bacterium RIFOXYA2_FULL_38_24]OGY88258.1 MAG: cell division protein FtsA [Candidatus Kerfeldbacteria bacterium RIFOXYB2_FULL_38_14]OGY89381.1 MAG: cell division protein FtsA [Candidatus Kerfeldbacteria bacterium RIFOXYC2_FULL_38_9]